MNTRSYFLFISIIAIIIVIGVLAMPGRASAATVTPVSDLTATTGGYTLPYILNFGDARFMNKGVWGGMWITDVIKNKSAFSGVNNTIVNEGVLVGGNASDVGFPAPVGVGDNLISVEQGIVVSDYGPLSSHVTAAFVTRDSLGRITPVSVTSFGIKITTPGAARMTLIDSQGRILESVMLTSATSFITCQPTSFIVLEFAIPTGSGLAGLSYDRASLVIPGSQFGTLPPPTSGGSTPTCNCNQQTPGTGTPGTGGRILGAETNAPAIIVGAQTGTPPEVRVYAPNGSLKVKFNAFEENFTGGVQVGMGDLEGDGINEIIAAPGPGATPQIRIFSLTGRYITSFFAYDTGFRGGVNIAVGDIEGDGKSEIVTAPKRGGGPNVRIFAYRGGNLVPTTENFSAYDPKFRGGVNIALGDVDGDGQKDIVTAPESGGGPQLRLFSFKIGIYRPSIMGLMAYSESFRGGVNVAAGDLNGDGHAEVVTAPQSGGGPQVRIFSYTAQKTLGLSSPGFMAYDANFKGGVNVAVIDLFDDGKAEIVTAPESGMYTLLHFFNQDGSTVNKDFYAFASDHMNGVNIAQGYLE